jgi:PAS domain S-box-containing protein
MASADWPIEEDGSPHNENGLIGAPNMQLHDPSVQAKMVSHDASGREAAQAGLGEIEARYRALVEQLPAVVYLAGLGESGDWHYVSPQIESILGYTSEEWLAHPHPFATFAHPQDRDEVLAQEAMSRATGKPCRVEYRILTRDGRMVWIRDEATVVSDGDGTPLLLQGVMFDITELKETQQRLAEQEEHLRVIVASEPECVKLLSHDGTLLQMNPAGLEMIEADSTDQVLGQCIYPLVAPEHREAFRSLTEGAFRGESAILEFELVGLRGTRRWMETHSVPLPRAGGGIAACLSITRDISERRRAEDDLRRSLVELRQSNEDRSRLLSRLVTAQEQERRRIGVDIHDDTIQAVAAVALRLDLLQRDHPDLEGDIMFSRLAASVHDAVARLRGLVFELHPSSLDTDGLEAALRTYVDGSPGDDEPVYEVNSRLVAEPCLATRTILYRIAQEALMNARKHARASRVSVGIEERSDGFLLRVADDGVGFDATSSGDSAPGHLGLTSMRERAETQGGWVRIESTPGSGTAVEAWLPAISLQRESAVLGPDTDHV